MRAHLLGSGAAVSDAWRTTTMLAVTDGASTLGIDCGGDFFQRFLAADLDPGTLDAMLLTHEHPDHVSGFPLLVEKLWLWGRREPLPVYGPPQALGQARRIWEAFDTEGWKAHGLFEIDWREVPLDENATVLDTDRWRVTGSPVDHAVPTMGVRVEEKATGKVVGYPCDTAPCPAATALGRDADLYFFEATGAIPHVHSSPEEAAQSAAEASAQRLVLVHLPPGLTDDDLADARAAFAHTEIGEEGGVYEV